GTTSPIPVAPGPLGSFTWANITSPRTAGTAFPVTVTAYDTFGNQKTDYAGTGAVLSSTLGNSPNSSHPTVDGVAFSGSSNLSWEQTTGSATASIKEVTTSATADQYLTITSSAGDGSKTADSAHFAVSPG